MRKIFILGTVLIISTIAVFFTACTSGTNSQRVDNVNVADRSQFDACATGVAFLQSVKRIAPEVFASREKPYEFVADIPAIDLLAGDDRLRRALDADADLAGLMADWARERSAFEPIRREAMLY